MAKPKLIFFQFQIEKGLSKFIALHRQHHIKCLKEFFEVIVVEQDCDYQQICDLYQPDLTLFEGGVNYRDCRRLEIKNPHAYPEIPKLGLHNGDSWCEARTGFLADMEQWGIENFFSICTTTAEHIPAIADNLFVWPNFIDTDIYRDYNQPKNIPILFTGSLFTLYPWRQEIYKIVTQNYPSLVCPHLGYQEQNAWRMLSGEQYARTINSSMFVPTCGTVEKELIRKHLEIPACKSCLVTENIPILEAAGFIDMKNCIFADKDNILDKLDYLFQNQDELEKITNASYQLVHSQHTLKQRNQIFQWFDLYRKINPNQKIIQPGPFEPLVIVGIESGTKNLHINGEGLVLELLRQGDQKLWAGDYQEAECLYTKCLNYIYWMPEPKLKLTLCNLYQGKPDAALNWVLQPLQYTLETYKAVSPDPVEWAYFIICLLCQGKLSDAVKHIRRFPSLHHPELDRTCWLLKLLEKQSIDEPLEINSERQQYSIHSMPDWSLETWLENICEMLEACKQTRYVQVIQRSTSLGKPYSTHKHSRWFNLAKAQGLIDALKPEIAVQYSSVLPLSLTFKRSNNLFGWFKTTLMKFVERMLHTPLNRLESEIGYFLPYSWSIRRENKFAYEIRELVQDGIKTVLLLGASDNSEVTEIVLLDLCVRMNGINFFLANNLTPQFKKLKKRWADHESIIFCDGLSNWQELRRIKRLTRGENSEEFDSFDLVIIDGSEIDFSLEIGKICGAKLIILDDVNMPQNHRYYQSLLVHQDYKLLSQNLDHRNGYAIFKKIPKPIKAPDKELDHKESLNEVS